MFISQYPLVRFGSIGREMNRLFDDVFPGFTRTTSCHAGFFPAMDVWEDADTIWVEAEVPGFQQDEIDVHATGNDLTIEGQRKQEKACEDGLTYHQRERNSGKFSRMLTLPFDVDASKVEASLKDGILTVRLPKAEAIKRKKITVSLT